MQHGASLISELEYRGLFRSVERWEKSGASAAEVCGLWRDVLSAVTSFGTASYSAHRCGVPGVCAACVSCSGVAGAACESGCSSRVALLRAREDAQSVGRGGDAGCAFGSATGAGVQDGIVSSEGCGSGGTSGRGSDLFCSVESGQGASENVRGGACYVKSGDGTKGVSSGVSSVVSGPSLGVKGPNWEKNRRNREEKKQRKLKRKEMGKDWRLRVGDTLVSTSPPGSFRGLKVGVGGDQSGAFWNSTDAGVRQELVDSKARMHIAENKRRERKALDEIAYLDSPEAAMRKAISMIDYAEKQAKKENDNKVYGWARAVATSSAESLARSTPDSVPSFDALSKKLEASSQSSFELELKAKEDELNKERAKYADELSLERAKYAAVVARVTELEKEKVKPSRNLQKKNFSDFMVDRARERERVIMSFHDEI